MSCSGDGGSATDWVREGQGVIRSWIDHEDHEDHEVEDGERTGSTPLSIANRTQLAPRAKACLMALYWLGSTVGANRVSVVL